MTDTAVEKATDADEYRIERDTMGEVRVPKDALWRAQTQRAVENFPISGRGLERAPDPGARSAQRRLRASEQGPRAAQRRQGRRDHRCGRLEIAHGKHDDQFPIDVFQTGSGTSSNMNTNEVIAGIAARNGLTVHPNDDVNMSQSSNDTFPTATHIAATEAAVRDLIPALEVLHEALAGKARQWRTVVKSGRTHLMDAVPVTLGQEFSGYARQVEAGIERVRAVLPRLGELAIGGTAVGTGLNAPDGFGEKVVEVLKEQTGLAELRPAVNSFEAQAARDGLVEASGALRTIAVSLTKIANDIRWMGSGPLTGLAESSCRTCSRAVRSCRARSIPYPRSGYAGGGAGGRQRRRDRVGGCLSAIRTQRLHPDDGPQRAGVAHDAVQCVESVRRSAASTGWSPTRIGCAHWRSRPRRSSRR